MIGISVRYGRDGSIEAFSANGHAGYDEAGRDIVCAAVSAVVQTAVIGLTDVVGLSPDYRMGDGFLECSLPAGLSDKDRKAAGVVLHTMLAGLRSIQYSYPDLISIEEREVE